MEGYRAHRWTLERSTAHGVRVIEAPNDGEYGIPRGERVEVVRADAYLWVVEAMAARLAEDGDFDRWMRLQHLDRRNGTTEARDAILAFLRRAGDPA
jgi:hypothetical protein